MINAAVRTYNYYTYGNRNEYGQPTLSASPVGQVKMAINLTSQSIQSNINYAESQYVGLTFAEVDNTYVIEYGDQKLKVLYVNKLGRMNQVFMATI